MLAARVTKKNGACSVKFINQDVFVYAKINAMTGRRYCYSEPWHIPQTSIYFDNFLATKLIRIYAKLILMLNKASSLSAQLQSMTNEF